MELFQMSEEKLPCHESITVLKSTTIYKNKKWWCAVVLAETFGHKKVLIYLWSWVQGKWKRKNKFAINFKQNWTDMKPVIDEYVQEAGI